MANELGFNLKSPAAWAPNKAVSLLWRFEAGTDFSLATKALVAPSSIKGCFVYTENLLVSVALFINYLFFSPSTRVRTQDLYLEPLHQPIFVKDFFQDRVLWTICQGWLQTMILLISASWVARITGGSHQRPTTILTPPSGKVTSASPSGLHLHFHVMETASFLKPQEPASASFKLLQQLSHLSQPSQNGRSLGLAWEEAWA
jgi:hypothetical protein